MFIESAIYGDYYYIMCVCVCVCIFVDGRTFGRNVESPFVVSAGSSI